jgi:hypothetical protein
VLTPLRLTYITCIVIQIYLKSNSLQICSLVSRGEDTPDFFRKLQVSWRFRTWSEHSGSLKGKYNIWRWLLFLLPFYRVDWTPLHSRHSLLPSVVTPLATSNSIWPNRVRVRDWGLQGVENKDLLQFWRLEASRPLSPKVSLEDQSRSISPCVSSRYLLREYMD